MCSTPGTAIQKVIEAVRKQLDLYTHTAFQVMAYEPYIALCEKLNALAPFKGPAKTILFTTGAEAAENAVKIARAATGRSAVIAFTGGFHGRTMMTMAMTGKVLPYKRLFSPMPSEVLHSRTFPIAARHCVTVEDSLKALTIPLPRGCRARSGRRHYRRAGSGRGWVSSGPKAPRCSAALRELCRRTRDRPHRR